MFAYVIPVLLLIYGGLNYYIGLRLLQWLTVVVPTTLNRPVYWIIYWLLALSFPLTRMTAGWVPLWLTEAVARISGYWLALYVYVLPLLLLIDVVRLLNRLIPLLPARVVDGASLVKVTGGALCLLFVGLMLYGTWRARNPVVTAYDVAIAKPAGAYEELNVVLISDTHFGHIIGKSRARQLVAMVNDLEPDLILFAGDTIDDDFRPFVAHDMAAELSKMKARLGTYGVLGNHDAGSEDLHAFRAELERAGIRLLVDEWVKVDDSFYVVGRNDSRSRGASLQQVLAGVDPSLPVLLMDHQPDRLAESEAAGVDLQVSGHTHRGQLWPGSLITSRIFEVDWGYLQKGASQFIVSLGYATWGPPVRIGNTPEVVQIHLTFGK